MATQVRAITVWPFISIVCFIIATLVALAAAFGWVTSTSVSIGWLAVAFTSAGFVFLPLSRVF